MQNTIDRIQKNIVLLKSIIFDISETDLTFKRAANKWSRKEVLGHLIDSAQYNLKRFNQIQLTSETWTVVPYPQNELVVLNNYQNIPLADLVILWQALNHQVIAVLKNIDIDTLENKVIVFEEDKNLRWLIEDYADHMDHHFKQILHQPFENKGSTKFHISLEEAELALEAIPEEFIKLAETGDLEIEFYQPNKIDKQTPHEKDELYIVAKGTGTFMREGVSYEIKENDVLFVPAKQEHRFVNFSADFATWVIFYGL